VWGVSRERVQQGLGWEARVWGGSKGREALWEEGRVVGEKMGVGSKGREALWVERGRGHGLSGRG